MSDVARELRALGAREDTSEGAPLCRWVLDDVQVDVMTPSAKVLGFTNQWYAAALRTSEEHTLPDGTVIHVTTGPLFLATKIEAFRGRGGLDFRASKDIEDIVAILDGRLELLDEVAAAEDELRAFLRGTLADWLAAPDFREALPGHLAGDAASQDRAEVILERVESIAHPHGDT
jgi:hypothetical protein